VSVEEARVRSNQLGVANRGVLLPSGVHLARPWVRDSHQPAIEMLYVRWVKPLATKGASTTLSDASIVGTSERSVVAEIVRQAKALSGDAMTWALVSVEPRTCNDEKHVAQRLLRKAGQ
jgi:hypothetical protein